MTIGSIGILNVGAGDTKLVFNRDDPQDLIRASRIVKDMLRRGYALLIRVPDVDPPRYTRALDFDEATCEYIIADFDPTVEDQNALDISRDADHKLPGEVEHVADAAVPQDAGAAPSKHGRRNKTRRISATDTTGTAVSRSAGG